MLKVHTGEMLASICYSRKVLSCDSFVATSLDVNYHRVLQCAEILCVQTDN